MLLHSPGYQQVRSSTGTSGEGVDNWSTKYKVETIGWRSCY